MGFKDSTKLSRIHHSANYLCGPGRAADMLITYRNVSHSATFPVLYRPRKYFVSLCLLHCCTLSWRCCWPRWPYSYCSSLPDSFFWSPACAARPLVGPIAPIVTRSFRSLHNTIMPDTTSPDYLAGVAAGRKSFRLSVFAGFAGQSHELVKDASLPIMCKLSGTGPIEFGQYRLLVTDTMPDFEDYPDAA